MDNEFKSLSQGSTTKLVESAYLFKRQKRVVEVFSVIDSLKLSELKDVELVVQAQKLPADSTEKHLVEGTLENLSVHYREFSPSAAGIGGAIGAGMGSLIGLLVARSIDDRNYVGWAGLGGAIGGAVGALIGSLWDS